MLVYHQLTTKAWRQILKSKKLWVLGLLASALMPYSLWEYIIYHPQQPWQISLKDLLLQQNNDLYQNLSYWLQQLITTPRLGISALMIGLFLLLMLISFAAQALIIKQAPLKKQTTPDFKEISRQLPVLIITQIVIKIALYLISLLILVIMSLILINTSPNWLNLNFKLLYLVILTLTTLSLTFVSRFSLSSIIHYKTPPLQAIKNSFKLFSKQWLVCLELTIWLNFWLLLGLVLSFLTSSLITSIIILILGNSMLTTNVLVISSILTSSLVLALVTATSETAWSLLFIGLTKKSLKSKTLRFFESLVEIYRGRKLWISGR